MFDKVLDRFVIMLKIFIVVRGEFMFIAFSDASIKNYESSLGFFVIFEDKSIIRRRIIVHETKSSLAEALAFCELLSFLDYYNMEKGVIVFDATSIESQINKGKSKDTKDTLENLQIRTQLIPRKLNVAHKICYRDKFQPSSKVSSINRSFYSSVPNYPEYYMQLSVLSEYRKLYEKQSATLYEAQMKLNKIIWLADLFEDIDGIKRYAIHDKRIVVKGDTIVKISRVNYVQIGNHWRVMRRSRKLKEILK